MKSQRGASAVEFAVVLPLLLVLVFGIIEFGILFAQDLAISNGARQGARLAVAGARPGGPDEATCDEIIAEVRAAATTVGVAPGDVGVSVEPAGGPACTGSSHPCNGLLNGNVTVVATFEASLNIPLVPVGPTVDLEREGVFRCEYS